MSMQVETFTGKKIEKIYEDIQKKHQGNYQILEQKTKKKFAFFGKNYEVKVLIGEKKEGEKPKKQMKQEDKNKELILSMLEKGMDQNKETVSPTVGNTQEIETMKKMMEKMMEKMDSSEKEQGFLEEKNERIFADFYHIMLQNDIEENLARKFILEAKTNLPAEQWLDRKKVEQELTEKMAAALRITGPFDMEKTKTIALVGPTGVGKTTTLAKISAILKQENKRIGLISTDVYRIGAIQQLETYANIMNSKMIEASNPQELKDAIDYFKNVEKVDQILIDTVGRSPMKKESIDLIKEYLEISKPDHTALVLSSTQKYKDMLQITKNYEEIDVSSLIFTKLDETMSYGFMLNVLEKSGLHISYVTNGQNVPKDIYAATSEVLAKKMLNGDDDFGSSGVTA